MRKASLKEKKVREDEPDLAIHKNYPSPFGSVPDLLIPHIGSIKRYELAPQFDEEEPMFYPNHLGLLGTAKLIKELNPKAAILSEFGAELKDFRVLIARFLQEAISNKESETFIIPGDSSLVYDVTDGKFLCHEDCHFHDLSNLEAKEVERSEIGLFLKNGFSASLSKYKNALQRAQCENNEEEDDLVLPYVN